MIVTGTYDGQSVRIIIDGVACEHQPSGYLAVCTIIMPDGSAVPTRLPIDTRMSDAEIEELFASRVRQMLST